MPQLSLNNLLPKKPRSFFSKLLITLVDYLLGISQLNRVYQDSGLKGLEKKAFATRFVDVFASAYPTKGSCYRGGESPLWRN
jgi:hypothetical protein